MERSDEVITLKPNDEDGIYDELLFPNCQNEITLTTRRRTCTICGRPRPSSCICAALPNVKLSLVHTYCIILQHPNESKQHQNCTLPFIEHCFDSNSYMKIIGRRFPTLVSENCETTSTDNDSVRKISSYYEDHKLQYLHVMNSISERSTTQIWLLSSNDRDGTSITLTQALKEWEEQKDFYETNNSNDYPHIIVIALDATWKYANEMDRANVQHGCYPKHGMRRVRLTAVDFQHQLFQHQGDRQNGDEMKLQQYSSRFLIRTPPKTKEATDDHGDRKSLVYLSTAECLSYVLARIEQNDNIYHTVMKPLDLMVQQWRSHYINSTSK